MFQHIGNSVLNGASIKGIFFPLKVDPIMIDNNRAIPEKDTGGGGGGRHFFYPTIHGIKLPQTLTTHVHIPTTHIVHFLRFLSKK